MAPPHQAPDVSSPGEPAGSPPPAADEQPRIIRLRLAPWDVVCTIALILALVIVATTTDWPAQLFGFLADVCTDDTRAPAPFGIDFFIYPVVWGGAGAALAAVIVGPVVSLLKGWYMSFWPVLALLVILASAVAGSAITAFSHDYWHANPAAAVGQASLLPSLR